MYVLRMDAFEAYKHYVALKNHFTSNNYDYFKYNGHIRAKRESFESRNDKYFFQKLAKRKDLVHFLVSLFVYGSRDSWIGDIVRNEENERMYNKWQKVRQAITYVFSNDIENFEPDLKGSFDVVDGQHPLALRLLLSETIHIETFIIMNDIIKFVPHWNKHITDTVVWPSVRHKCKKYQPFMEYDVSKCRQIVVDKFGDLT